MSASLVFAIPGDIETLTGGYAYDRRMIAELRRVGFDVRHLPLPGGFPNPTADEVAATAALFAAIPDGTTVLVDGLAFGVLDELAAREGRRLDLTALVHHPLADESGMDEAAQEKLLESERRALARARAVVVTSPATGRALTQRFGVEAARITVAEPGCEASGRATLTGAPPVVLSVGTFVFRKGHDVLIEAMSRLVDLDWRCRIVGASDRSPATTADLLRRIEAHGLADRIALIAEAGDIGAEMRAADLFVLATRHEGYGMVFAEAMAHGLPIVGTNVGAVPELVPTTAGRLVDPDAPDALAAALAALLSDPEERHRKGAGALAAAARLPTWAQCAARLADIWKGGRP